MRYLNTQLRYFYNGVIPEGSETKIALYNFVFVIPISIILILFLGKFALILIPAVILAYLTFRFPMSPLYLFFATVPLTPFIVPNLHTFYSYFLVMLTIALCIGRIGLRIKTGLDISKFLLIYITLFCFVLFSSALNKGVSRPEIITILRYALYFPFVLALYDLYQPRNAIMTYIAITIPLIISSFYLAEAYMKAGSFFEMLALFRLKPGGFFSNANVFGIMMIFAAPFWTAIAIWGKKWNLRIFAAALSMVLIISIVLTNCRSAMVGIFFSIVFYFAIAKKLRYFFSIAAVIAIIFLSSPLLRVVISAGLRVERGTTNREEIWRNSIDLLKRNFLFGVGAGNYKAEFSPYIKTAYERGFIKDIPHAHNEVLNASAELGIGGFILIMILYYFPLKRGFQLLRKPLSEFDRMVLYGAMGILFANIGDSIFDSTIMLADGGLFRPILYWFTMIVVLKMYAKYQKGDNEFRAAVL